MSTQNDANEKVPAQRADFARTKLNENDLRGIGRVVRMAEAVTFIGMEFQVIRHGAACMANRLPVGMERASLA